MTPTVSSGDVPFDQRLIHQSPVRGRVRYIVGSFPEEVVQKIALKMDVVAKSISKKFSRMNFLGRVVFGSMDHFMSNGLRSNGL